MDEKDPIPRPMDDENDFLLSDHHRDEKTIGADATAELRDEEPGFEQTGSSSGAATGQSASKTT